MGARTKFVAAGLVAGSVIATGGVSIAGSGGHATPARDTNKGMASGVFRSGPIKGIVLAEQRSKVRRARVFVSLQGVPSSVDKAYLVFDTKPCSAVIDDTDIVLGIIMANTEGDIHIYGGKPVRLQQRLGAARTVRVYEREQDAELSQLACTEARIIDKSSPKI
jgi:hypothetical protein